MMSNTLRFTSSLLLGMLLGGMIVLGHSVFADRQDVSKQALPYESLRVFSEVFSRIKEDYVKEVEDKELIENAIQGMLSGLDPHSAYLTKDDYTEMQIGTTGEFGGLGIEVSMQDGFVKVVSPIDDTPAQRAGIQAGDLVVRLDNTPVKGMSLNEAVNIMRGKPGTDITLTVVRDGEDKPLQITITRDVIKIKSVKQRSLEAGYGYVRISQFQARTRDDLHKALNELLKENEGRLNGLVLDLRNNPGGVLNAAVDVADTFLKRGLIVYTEGRVENTDLKFKARPKDMLNGTPLVVLVNSGSASASEIVAGALQDHKRAIIMGNHTFGKGSVQTILPMKNNAALKLTTALYFTPNGRSIQAEGIKPDIMLDRVEIASVEKQEVRGLTEADLRKHLSNGNGDKAAEPEKAQENKKDNDKTDQSEKEKAEELPLVKRDYQVYEALNLLKGLNIVQTYQR